MYAIVRLNTFDPDELAAVDAGVRAFDALHAAQPGFVGNLTIDLQAGRRVIVNIWQSRQHATAGLSVLAPEVGRVLHPLMSEPSQLIGSGDVIANDLLPLA